MTTTPTPPERNETTGAVVAWAPWPIAKYAVFDCRGHLCGYRMEVEDARALAASLPGEPWVPPEPSPIHVSPRAHPEIKARPGVKYEEPGPQPDEKPMPARHEPKVVHSKEFVMSRMYWPKPR
jgi:hypothetical protein